MRIHALHGAVQQNLYTQSHQNKLQMIATANSQQLQRDTAQISFGYYEFDLKPLNIHEMNEMDLFDTAARALNLGESDHQIICKKNWLMGLVHDFKGTQENYERLTKAINRIKNSPTLMKQYEDIIGNIPPWWAAPGGDEPGRWTEYDHYGNP